MKRLAAKIRNIPDNKPSKEKDFQEMEEMSGSMSNAMSTHDAMMKSRLPAEEDLSDGKMLNDMINQGMSSFQPDMAMASMTQNYKSAKNIYGESMLREATGYSPEQIERNIKLPEFARDLKSRMHAKAKKMQEEGLINEQGEILSKGMMYAALNLYMTELDSLLPTGTLGDHTSKKKANYGMRGEVKPYARGDRYKNLAVKQSAKVAIRRGHTKIQPNDLRIFTRESKGEICIVYAIDSSGSMRGKKIETAKRAGVALAYKAVQNNDKIGVLVFAEDIKARVEPTTDFHLILSSISTITAAKQTDIGNTMMAAIDMFPQRNMTKHLIFLTDAETTVGDDPKKKALEAANVAAGAGITISLVGIKLDPQTAEFARELVNITKGKLYLVNDTKEVDAVVLADYDQIAFG
jgi:Mg-chelatase subunit ChlD